MKIAFFGTPPFTLRFLEALQKAGYAPSLIVTNPDRPSGRGMELKSPEPKLWGERHGIRVLQPEKLTPDIIAELEKESWDLFVVVAYGRIMPETLINLPRFGTINVHYSLLPKYRGATPVESAILSGDAVTGITIQQMRFKLDTGPIIAQETVAIAATDTTLTLRDKLNDAALTLLPETIEEVFAGNISQAEQDDSTASHCTKIAKEDGEITMGEDSLILDRKFRAYTPWPGLYFYTKKGDKDIRVKITKAHMDNGVFSIDEVVPENSKAIPYDIFVLNNS